MASYHFSIKAFGMQFSFDGILKGRQIMGTCFWEVSVCLVKITFQNFQMKTAVPEDVFLAPSCLLPGARSELGFRKPCGLPVGM